MKKVNAFISVILIAILISCQAEKPKTTKIWVNSYQVSCDNSNESLCLQIQRGDTIESDKWETLPSNIEGFNYEEGKIYQIEIGANEPSSNDKDELKFNLVKIIQEFDDNKLIINGKWELTFFMSDTLSIHIDRPEFAPNLEINISERKVFGQDGCNNFTGSISEFDAEIISCISIVSTKKICPDNQLDDVIANTLTLVNKWKVEDSILSLLNSEGEALMKFKKSN